MSEEEVPHMRPISLGPKKEGPVAHGGRPTLEDVLNNRAPSPYTLAAYTAFLSQQHCLETLEFTTEAKRYSTKYDEAAAHVAGMPLSTETVEGFELMQDWVRLLEVYVKPGAPREINLPAEERDDLVECPYEPKPPRPENLEPAVKRMYDLMSDSIFIPFCNSFKPVAQSQTWVHDFPGRHDQWEPVRLTFDEDANTQRRQESRRRRSPPTSSASFETSRSTVSQYRATTSNALSHALNKTTSGRLSTHISHGSAISESALTDDSGNGDSLMMEPDLSVTPPTTPPLGDVNMSNHHHHPRHNVTSTPGLKTQRSDSGGWKKMGMKIFGGGKKKSNSQCSSHD